MVDCSNMFYGSPDNLILPGRARHMGEGWETARRRDDGNDWVIVRLAAPGPSASSSSTRPTSWATRPAGRLAGCRVGPTTPLTDAWFELLPRTRLQPDTRHRFLVDEAAGPHVRLDVYPDGGMARLRVWGEVV